MSGSPPQRPPPPVFDHVDTWVFGLGNTLIIAGSGLLLAGGLLLRPASRGTVSPCAQTALR